MPRAQTSPGSKPDKNMSSRLLTMKFMQRAAASNAAKDSQPASADASTQSTPKKRRISSGPESPVGTPLSDLEAISAALAEEESRRREAVARQAAEAGETQWVIDFDGANTVNQYAQQSVVLADYSLDADDDEIGSGGRQAYGNYKSKRKSRPSGDGSNDQDGSSPAGKKSVVKNMNEVTTISGGGRGNQDSGENDKPKRKNRGKKK